MADFVLFALASIGMTLILVRGTLFQPFRDFLANRAERIRLHREHKELRSGFTLTEFLSGLISCAQCMGFWCGLFCGVFLITADASWIEPNSYKINPRYLFNRILMLFCCGAAGSFLSVIGDIFLEWLFFSKMLLMRRFEDEEHQRSTMALSPENNETEN
ncbi:MAG: DUF1360 domain-containing protein [Planctomycetaceae bacterium]|jgi:hypothetical protein|nr:DUF1360 domain-containing protein [Planctomycetaceae bacterium]